MTLREARIIFSSFIALMPAKAKELGYDWAFDELTNNQGIGHEPGSLHFEGLAGDGLLYKNGVYIITAEGYSALGAYWKTLHQFCKWGGDFQSKDYNHFSFAPPELVGNRE